MRTATKTSTKIRAAKPDLSRAAKAWATRRKDGGKDAGHSSAVKAWVTRRAALKAPAAMVRPVKVETAKKGRKAAGPKAVAPKVRKPSASEQSAEKGLAAAETKPERKPRGRKANSAASTGELIAGIYPRVDTLPPTA